MPWNGSGQFNRTNGVFTGATVWDDSRVAGRTVRSDDHDTHDEDIATGLENTVTRDGQNQPSANLPMGNFRHTGVGNASARNDYAAAGQVQDQSFTFVPAASVAGTADAITLSPTPAITAYAAGQRFSFVAEGNNTGAVTVNVSSVGAQAVQKTGSALVSGDILTGNLIVVEYDGTQFQLLTPSALLLNAALTNASNTFTASNTFNSSNTFAADQTIVSTNSGSGTGPNLIIYRNSSSPAANDGLGVLKFDGEDSASNQTTYATIRAVILDPANGAEDGQLRFQTFVGGTDATRLILEGGLYTSGATGGDQGTNTFNASQIFDDGNQIHALQDGLETEQSTSSGTAFNFTGIRSDARRITVIFESVSLSGTDDILVQIGDSGGLETTGYISTSMEVASTVTAHTATNGFVIDVGLAARALTGHLVLTNISDGDGLSWVASHSGRTGTGSGTQGGGTKTLSARLDRLTITRTGSDTFDGGSVNILVE